MSKFLLDKKEAYNAGWLIFGKVFQMILSFFISVLTARYLGPSNFGVINYATAYVAFFTSLCTLGINAVIVKEFVDNPNNQGAIIGTTLVLRLISSILSIVMISIIVAIVDQNEKVTLLVVVLSSISLVFQIFDTINYWFQAQYKSKITALATLVAYIFTSIYKVILLMLGKNVVWFAVASSIDYFVLAIFLFVSYINYSGPKLSFSLTEGKKLLGKSYHYILSGMMVSIYAQTDKLMLKQMMDSSNVGYYSLASTINGMWVFVLIAIIDSMSPTIMRCFKEGDILSFNKKTKQLYALIIYISIFVAICIMFLGRIAIVFVYGESYEPASNILRIVSLYTIFSYLGVARNAWIVCMNKQKYLKYMYFSAAIINIVFNFILIPLFGGIGAAIASLITQICTSIILPLFIKDMRPNTKLMIEAFMLKF